MAEKNKTYYGRLYSREEVDKASAEYNKAIIGAYSSSLEASSQKIDNGIREGAIHAGDIDGLYKQAEDEAKAARNDAASSYKGLGGREFTPVYDTDNNFLGFKLSDDKTDFSGMSSAGSASSDKETSIINFSSDTAPENSPALLASADTGASGQGQNNGSMYSSLRSGGNFTTKETEYITPAELRGRSDEDVAGKKTKAKIQTSSDKWKATESGSKTSDKVKTAETAQSGNKHAYGDEGQHKAYHTVDVNKDSRHSYRDEGELRSPNARVVDASGRTLEAGGGLKSGLSSGTLKGAFSKTKGKKIESGEGKDSDGEYISQKKVEKREVKAIDVSRVNRNTKEAVKKVGEAAKGAVESDYQEADAVQGAQEMREEGKKYAFATGGTAIAHAGVRANIHAGITQRSDIDRYSRFDVDKNGVRLRGKPGIVKTETKTASGIVVTEGREKTALRRGLDQAESEAGGSFVTDAKNSYGSLVKDIKNNMFIIDNHFKKQGLDIAGYNEAQIKAAISKGFLINKTGKNVALSESDKALLSERLKLMRKEKALKATGTWRDDAKDFLSSTYSDSDFYQGYRVTKTTAKAAEATLKAGKVAVGSTVKGVEVIGTAAAMTPNAIKRAGVNIAGGIGGIGSKKVRKWRFDQNAKFRDKNAQIKAKSGRLRSATGKVTDAPIKSLAKVTGKGISKLAGATVGKTRFGKAISNGFGKMRNARQAVQRRWLNMTNRIRNNPVTRVIGTPFRAVGKVVSAVNTMKIILMIAVLIMLAVTTLIIILTSAISSIIPDGADKSNFDSGVTLWDMSKDGMNQELKDIADETESWINANYRAYRRDYGGLAIRYKTRFIFSGFEIYGPTNTVTERDEDTDAIKSYDTSLDKAEDKGTASVNESATAANGPLSGSTSATLTKRKGTVQGPSGKETYYNMDMANCVHTLDLHAKGKIGGLSDKAHYFVRSDGVKCYGDENGIAYVMVAANLSLRPKGTIVPTSLGPGIVADTGSFATTNPRQLDIAVAWTSGGNDDKYKTINSGTVDTWGSDLNAGAIYVDGSTACASNYLRGILAMATTATGNESEPDNSAFYTSYCRHILRNSYNYSKYVAALNLKGQKKAKKIYPEPPSNKAWDDACPTGFYSPAFDIQIIDKEYNDHNHLINVTFSVKLRLFDCGLWGEGDYRDEPEDNGWKYAGKGASPYINPTKVGMFDVESYPYTATAATGEKVSNVICDDDYIHGLAATGSEEYDVSDKKDKGYEVWDGWPDSGFFDDNTECIYESGSNTSNVEATYDIDDEDWADMGVSFDGLYNIDKTADDTDIGGTSAPLSSEDIAKISNNVSSSLTKDDAPERAAVIAKALSLCGKVKYTWGGSWSSSTTDSDIMRTGLDCAAFVSYCAYKGTHEDGSHLNIGFSSVQRTKQLKSAGKDCGKNLRPGDILVKIQPEDSQGHYRCHAVMYIGATSGGKFTIVEESGSRGAHLSYYSSYKDFETRRGDGVGYQYHRNVYGD